MMLIVSADAELASFLDATLPGESVCVVSLPRKPDDEVEEDEETVQRWASMTITEQHADEAKTQLRRRIYQEQPKVILLDVRFGGQFFRVVEIVPTIIKKTASRPRVILILPAPSKEVEDEASKLGCFDVLVFTSRRKKAFRREVLDAVEAAELDRRLADPPLPEEDESSKIVH